MTQTIVEMAKFKTRTGVTEADLLAASAAFQESFLDQQPGFVRRELLRVGRGTTSIWSTGRARRMPMRSWQRSRDRRRARYTFR